MKGAGEKPRTTGGRLSSWKEIAGFFDKDVRTVQRWEKNEGLPVHRKPHEKLSSVYAYESELESWWNAGSHPPSSSASDARARTRISPALVVLPLRDLGGNREEEYFSDGLTEELIAQIARLDPDNLAVIARSSAMKYKDTRKGIDQVGRELAVDYVLEGSVRREGDRVRISVALVRANDQTSLWSEVYDRDLRDILKLQIEVAESVAREIALKVSRAQSDLIARTSQVDPDAYSAYLRGRYFWNRRTPDSLRKAIRCFEEAVMYDRHYARAHAGLSDCLSLLTAIHVGAMPPADGMPKAIAAANQALQIDPTLAEAHTSLGHAQLWYEWNWPAAEKSFLRALELNPSYAPARQWYSGYLQTIGRIDEALAELARALALDPLSLVINTAMQATLYLERRYHDVIDESKKTLELDSTFVLTYFNLGRTHTQMKMHRQAIAELKKALALSDQSPAMMMQLGYAYARAGKKADAETMLGRLGSLRRRSYVPAFYSAAIYTGLGDLKRALEWLRKAHAERCDYFVYLPKEPAADPLRVLPGFADLVPTPPASTGPRLR